MTSVHSDQNINEEEGWEPAESQQTSVSPKEQRSLDIGGSGQFAPGGYYNQQGVTQPDRLDLDEQFPDKPPAD